MEPVHVFLRENAGIDDGAAQVRRHGGLHENAVQARVGIQSFDERQQFGFACRFRQNMGFRINPQLRAGLFLPAHIYLRSRVFADPHERQPWLKAARLQSGDASNQFVLQFPGDGPSVNKVDGRHYSTTWMFWIVRTGVFPQRSSRPSSPVTTIRRPL